MRPVMLTSSARFVPESDINQRDKPHEIRGVRSKPSGAWMPEQVVGMLFDGMALAPVKRV